MDDLFTLAGVWETCDSTPTVRVIECDGLGTFELSSTLGSYQKKSKKRPPPRQDCRTETSTRNVRTAASSTIGVVSFNVRGCWRGNVVTEATVSALNTPSNITVGESPQYSISGVLPNTPVLWSSTLNGVSTGEVDADYGHVTDDDGKWSGTGGPWQATQVGDWTKTVKVGDRTLTVSFTVVAGTTPATVTVDKVSYSVGESPLYTVSGAPNSPIYWSSTLNGSPTGESDAYCGTTSFTVAPPLRGR